MDSYLVEKYSRNDNPTNKEIYSRDCREISNNNKKMYDTMKAKCGGTGMVTKMALNPEQPFMGYETHNQRDISMKEREENNRRRNLAGELGNLLKEELRREQEMKVKVLENKLFTAAEPWKKEEPMFRLFGEMYVTKKKNFMQIESKESPLNWRGRPSLKEEDYQTSMVYDLEVMKMPATMKNDDLVKFFPKNSVVSVFQEN